MCTGLCNLFTCSSSNVVQVRSCCDLSLSLCLSFLHFIGVFSHSVIRFVFLVLLTLSFFLLSSMCRHYSASHIQTADYSIYLSSFLSLTLVQYKSVHHPPGTKAVQWDWVQRAPLWISAEETSFSFFLLFAVLCCYSLFNFQHWVRTQPDFTPLIIFTLWILHRSQTVSKHIITSSCGFFLFLLRNRTSHILVLSIFRVNIPCMDNLHHFWIRHVCIIQHM